MGLGTFLLNTLCCAHCKPKKKVMVVGLEQSGKSTLVCSLIYRCFVEDILPTYGFNRVNFRCGPRNRLQITDFGGKLRFRPLWRHLYEEISLLIYVIDSTQNFYQPPCCEQCDRTEILKLLTNPQLRGVPTLFVATKQDLPGALRPDDIFAKLQLTSDLDTIMRAAHRPWAIVPFSAHVPEDRAAVVRWITSHQRIPLAKLPPLDPEALVPTHGPPKTTRPPTVVTFVPHPTSACGSPADFAPLSPTAHPTSEATRPRSEETTSV
eukprot:gnl/Trimastix_PCT/2987.p1 GENE.gnl/Trimastix_PCT/2987~~gnl/Trimastix_PCT/2987.p1  ORF type:complete len:276 (+),score=24.03 gnl/Trimastix_PCT/2987:34-828(+)